MFLDFLTSLLEQDAVRLAALPRLREEDRPAATNTLLAAFENHALDVAGASIAFNAPVALAAAECVAIACWFLVSRDERSDRVSRELDFPRRDDLPSTHLSADVVLRFLPAVYRRARSIDADDVLTRSLAKILRDWPLSGVLADPDGGPTTQPILGEHSGLLLLYAERLVAHPKPTWITDGPARPYVELVFAERGQRIPLAASQEVVV